MDPNIGPFANLQILWSKIVVYKSLDQSRGSTISHFVKRQKILNHQSKKFQTQHEFGIIVQSRNLEGYFWNLTYQTYFQSRNSRRFCFQIPNPSFK